MMLLDRLTFCLWTPLLLDASTQAAPLSRASQDASTQFSRSVFPRRGICSKKRSRATDPCHTTDEATPVSQEQREVPPLMCSSRFAGVSGHPPPPGLEEQSHLLPSHLIPSRAMPTRPPPTRNVSTVLAGVQNVSPLFPPQQPDASTAQAGQHLYLLPAAPGRAGHHAKKFISNIMQDADNPPLAIRDTWSAIQSVLHSAISKQQLSRSHVTLDPHCPSPLRPLLFSMLLQCTEWQYRPDGNTHREI